ncbi:MAG: dihydrofolate reductase family protein [Eubacteriales bacterium]|nr:dihydrofolate reductase family protein [Eubacteriales bacterium]
MKKKRADKKISEQLKEILSDIRERREKIGAVTDKDIADHARSLERKKQRPKGAWQHLIRVTDACEVVADTKGTLLWTDQTGSRKPLLILTSEQVTKEYLEYLDANHISWVACGKEKIVLIRAAEILAKEFAVARMAIVGGGTINAGFLAAGLLDEVSILLAPGIDGRKGMAAAFDGLPMETEPFQLKLEYVAQYDDGALWLRYAVKN